MRALLLGDEAPSNEMLMGGCFGKGDSWNLVPRARDGEGDAEVEGDISDNG